MGFLMMWMKEKERGESFGIARKQQSTVEYRKKDTVDCNNMENIEIKTIILQKFKEREILSTCYHNM